MRERLSLAMARRVALAAQGFADPRPTGPIDRRHLNRILARLSLLQIDSVSAVVRAHYMPLFSRLGPYPMSLLDDAASPKKRRLFEYWAHEASFLPLETWPLMQWRMERARANDESVIYKGLARWAGQNKRLIEAIYGEVAARRHVAADRPDVRARLAERKLIDVDLHMHTDHSSDCATPVDVLLASARAATTTTSTGRASRAASRRSTTRWPPGATLPRTGRRCGRGWPSGR